MPDISMCLNSLCPSKTKCYRYMAVPNTEWQSFSSFIVQRNRKKCDAFQKIIKGDIIKEIK